MDTEEKARFVEFSKNQGKKERGYVIGLAILAYFRAALILVLPLLLAKIAPDKADELGVDGVDGMIEAAISLGLGLWVHLSLSKAAVCTFAAYFIISVVIGMATGASSPVGAIIWSIFVIICVTKTFKLYSAWNEFNNKKSEIGE